MRIHKFSESVIGTILRCVEVSLLAIGLIGLIVGSIAGISWWHERSVLRGVAAEITASARDDQERLVQLTDWVYHNQGFAKNRSYFIWKRLEATPTDVLEHGGDCEDKSKLLVALLREVNIPASMAMIYPCEDCVPSHTVAIAKIGNDWTPADSVYNITFSDERGEVIPVERMRSDGSILIRRLDELVAERGAEDKVAYYKRELEPYHFITTVNWRKNILTQWVANAVAFTGHAPWAVPRPFLLDDPRQFFMVAGFAGGLFSLALAWISRILRRYTSSLRVRGNRVRAAEA